MISIQTATRDYEAWLRSELRGELVEQDIDKKHEKMARPEPFPFFRATYWRWAERIFEICPRREIENAPQVLSVGDIHVENYGMWRDADMRLIWGVNDFDEAAEMPYVLDPLRLAASALAGQPDSRAFSSRRICKTILDGYRRGLEKPRPFVLEKGHEWLRDWILGAESEDERRKFWAKLDRDDGKVPQPRYARALEAALPDGAEDIRIVPRRAGLGSLGRPRWVAIARWKGGPVVREAKALAQSAWCRTHRPEDRAIRAGDLACGRYRAPDPWLSLHDGIVVRRLAPHSRKIDSVFAQEHAVTDQLLRAMGRELGSIHAVSGKTDAILEDLESRDRHWLSDAAERAVDIMKADHLAWRKAWKADHGDDA